MSNPRSAWPEASPQQALLVVGLGLLFCVASLWMLWTLLVQFDQRGQQAAALAVAAVVVVASAALVIWGELRHRHNPEAQRIRRLPSGVMGIAVGAGIVGSSLIRALYDGPWLQLVVFALIGGAMTAALPFMVRKWWLMRRL